MSKEFDWNKYEDVEESPAKSFNWDDYANAEEAQQIEQKATQESSGGFNRLKGLLKSAGGPLASGAGGFVQGRANNLISLANLLNSAPAGNQFAFSGAELAEMPGGMNIPQLNLREYFPEGGLNTAAFTLADLFGNIQGANKFSNQLKELDPLFKGAAKGVGLGKYSNIGADVLRGATAGAATQGENRTLGAIGGGIGEGLFGALSKKRALENLIKGKEEALTPARQIYKEIENTLESAGKSGEIKTPKINWEALGKAVPEESFAPIKQLVDEGTYSSLNKAQSELSKIARSLHKTAGGDVTASYNAVKNAEKKIHGKLFERFNEVNPELAKKYQEANELYAKGIEKFDFLPFKEYENVMKKFGKSDKKLREKTLEQLLDNPEFRLGTAQEYPEIFSSNWNPLTDYLGKAIAKGLRK